MSFVAAAIAGGAALSYMGSRKASKAQENAARIGAEASAFTPYNVYSGYGSAVFGTEPSKRVSVPSGSGKLGMRSALASVVNQPPGKPRAIARLSPEYQAVRDAYLRMAGQQRGAITGYSPEDAASGLYDKLSALSRSDEEQARAEIENRLLAQGMLGSTGGASQMNAYNDAMADARLKRELAAYGMAQDDLDRMIARDMGLVQGATQLDALPMQNLDMGGVFGGRQSAGGQLGANLMFQAAQNRGDATAAFWSQLGSQVPTWVQAMNKPPTSQYAASGGGSPFGYSYGAS